MGGWKWNHSWRERVPPWLEKYHARAWGLGEQGTGSRDKRKGFGNVRDKTGRPGHTSEWQRSDVGGRAVLGDKRTWARDSKYTGPFRNRGKQNRTNQNRKSLPMPQSRIHKTLPKISNYRKQNKQKPDSLYIKKLKGGARSS